MGVIRRVAKLSSKIAEHSRWFTRDPAHYAEHWSFKFRPEKHLERLLVIERMPSLELEIDPGTRGMPHLNVMLPKIAGNLTGGPNTALNIACGLAALGVPTRVLSVDAPLPADMGPVWSHLRVLTGLDRIPNLTFGSTAAADDPARIGQRDVFFATSWTTAFRLKAVLPRMAQPQFIYLIQDFEPSFYPWSSAFAQALETYAMPYRALINEQVLADYLVATATGAFADPSFLSRCAVFEPAVDARLFHHADAALPHRQLLFYARPGNQRNLFEMGFEALRRAIGHPAFAGSDWRFTAIGDSTLPPLPLGHGRTLEPAPWLSYDGYAKLMRESDILLCPMLSPHTSYPVLEMAACRGIAVTNTFATKTQIRLDAMSDGVVAGAASIEGLSDGLVQAAQRLSEPGGIRKATRLAGNWQDALKDTIGAARSMFDEMTA